MFQRAKSAKCEIKTSARYVEHIGVRVSEQQQKLMHPLQPIILILHVATKVISQQNPADHK